MTTSSNNYFELFGLPLSFDIDRKELDQAYRKLQQVSHPDRFVNQATEFQRKAVQQTAYIAEAYHHLKSPVLRACHLLVSLGKEFDLATYTVTDIELLMEQMQYREQLAEIKVLADFDKLHEFSQSLQNLQNQTISKISGFFEQGVDSKPADLKNNICELQFLNKLALDLDEVEEQLLLEH